MTHYMRIILPTLFVLFSLSLPSALASTLRLASVHVSPNEIEFTCERSGSLVDRQTRDSITRRYGLVGKVNEINQMISGMRNTGYVSEGNPGRERLHRTVPYRGVFKKSMKFGKSATLTEAHIYGAFAGPGQGRLLADNRVKPYLLDDNRKKIESDYRNWAEQFDGELNALRRTMNDYIYVYANSERPDLSKAMRGTIRKAVPFNVCGKPYKVTIQINWERAINLEPGR